MMHWATHIHTHTPTIPKCHDNPKLDVLLWGNLFREYFLSINRYTMYITEYTKFFQMFFFFCRVSTTPSSRKGKGKRKFYALLLFNYLYINGLYQYTVVCCMGDLPMTKFSISITQSDSEKQQGLSLIFFRFLLEFLFRFVSWFFVKIHPKHKKVKPLVQKMLGGPHRSMCVPSYIIQYW